MYGLTGDKYFTKLIKIINSIQKNTCFMVHGKLLRNLLLNKKSDRIDFVLSGDNDLTDKFREVVTIFIGNANSFSVDENVYIDGNIYHTIKYFDNNTTIVCTFTKSVQLVTDYHTVQILPTLYNCDLLVQYKNYIRGGIEGKTSLVDILYDIGNRVIRPSKYFDSSTKLLGVSGVSEASYDKLLCKLKKKWVLQGPRTLDSEAYKFIKSRLDTKKIEDDDRVVLIMKSIVAIMVSFMIFLIYRIIFLY